MTDKKTVLVTGGTGKQGCAVAHELAGKTESYAIIRPVFFMKDLTSPSWQLKEMR